MELRYLRYFVAVAERRSFSRAAEDLHVAQSAVSKQVKILEEELGVALLIRNRRQVEVTGPGEVLLKEAQAVLNRVNEAVEETRRAARGEIGKLRIGCFGSAVAEFLPQLIYEFRKERPRVEVEVKDLSPAEQLDAVSRGEIDVGFTRRVAAQQARSLIQERVYSDEVYLVVAENHRFAAMKKVSLRALAEESFVFFERKGAPEFVDQLRAWCRRAGLSPRVVVEAPIMRTILMYVAAGIGVAFVPGCIRCYRQQGVVFLPVQPPPPPELELVMMRLKKDMRPVVAAWVERVRNALPSIRALMEGKIGAAGVSGRGGGKARRRG
jgi:DNA-binding transcriptional LysR family regulator